ncbi:MAG: asparagine synthase (glutamine-hydrolyzing) [Christensenellaceae bacterium]|jgi:asparagine synthase (glutamine-hydrolysing)|nr:asparagine synthase (glutamine-hydrolyzing) [Christensenellaceae bacterium]
MCGIAGHVCFDGKLLGNEVYDKMSEQLSRRGPDDAGLFKNNNCVLIHRRLVVIDPANGTQPMSVFERGENYTIVYNGELYNTNEVRKKLIDLGYDFKGYSDTEVVLKSYIEWNEGCVKKFNGIFAFAIYMSNKNELFAARDRLGVKPFFYYQNQNNIVFASEMSTLLFNAGINRTIDSFGIKQLLLMGPGKSCGRTCIKNVFELKPGEFLKFSKSGFYLQIYWKLLAKPHQESLENSINHIKYLVTDAVKKQIVSDVPLGCFLSGGLDSSIISKIVSDCYAVNNQQLSTYSVDYKDNSKYFLKNAFQPDSDDLFVDIISNYINSSHTKILLDSSDLANTIELACVARSLPGMADIDSSLLLFCNEIKKNHTVCLSGEGADEVFGGYPWYHNDALLFKDSFPWSNSIELRKQLFKKEIIGKDADDFVYNEYRSIIALSDYLDSDNVYERRMREMYMLNIYGFLQTLLDRKDRMSMYSGLEVRVPFCDYRIVEYGYNLPPKLKYLNGREKGIIRESFKNELPDIIIQRRKSPYPKTFNPLFLNLVREKLKLILSDSKSALSGLLNVGFLKTLFSDPEKTSHYWYGQLMSTPQIYAYLIQIEHFIKKFRLTY